MKTNISSFTFGNAILQSSGAKSGIWINGQKLEAGQPVVMGTSSKVVVVNGKVVSNETEKLIGTLATFTSSNGGTFNTLAFSHREASNLISRAA
ncbi:MAG TPA: hypothetical protein VGC74_03655 [Stenotrophomonas sp.]|jgi:hypothetical protein